MKTQFKSSNYLLSRGIIILWALAISVWGHGYSIAPNQNTQNFSEITMCGADYTFSYEQKDYNYGVFAFKKDNAFIKVDDWANNDGSVKSVDLGDYYTQTTFEAQIQDGVFHIVYVIFNEDDEYISASFDEPDCRPRISQYFPNQNATAIQFNQPYLNIGTRQPFNINEGDIVVKKHSDNSTVEAIGITSNQIHARQDIVLDDFSTQSWNVTSETTIMSLSNTEVLGQSQTLKLGIDVDYGHAGKDIFSAEDWTAYDSLIIYVYPLQNSNATVYTKSNGWSWYANTMQPLNAFTWQRLTYPLSLTGELSQIQGYGVQGLAGVYYIGAVALTGPSDRHLRIDLTNNFEPNTKYYVNYPDGILKDLEEEDFVGVDDNNSWVFTTRKAHYVWDTSTNPGIQAGNGTWGTDDYWSYTGTDLMAWPGEGSKAIFAGENAADGSYEVTVSGTQKPNLITFQSTGYELTGGTLELSGDKKEIHTAVDATINSTISGTYTKTGSEQLTVSSNHSGPAVFVNEGSLKIVGDGNPANFAGNLNIANNSKLISGNQNIMGANSSINLNGNNAVWDIQSFNENLAWLTGDGKINNHNGSLSLNLANGATQTFSGNINGSGSLHITGNNATTNAGTFVLNAPQYYTGTTYLVGGPQVVDNAKAILQLRGGTNVIPTSLNFGEEGKTGLMGKLVLGNNDGPSHLSLTTLNIAETSGDFSIVGGNNNSSNLTLNLSADITLNSFLGGNGTHENNLNLIKNDNQTLTIQGTNTYTGTTAINAGTLKLLGNINSAVTVASGATITGTGSTGNLNINDGAKFIPGNNGAGTFSTGALNLANNGELHFDIGDQSDLVTVNGNLSLNGKLIVTAGAGYKAGEYQIFSHTGNVANNLRVEPLPEGYSAKIETRSGKVFLLIYDNFYWDTQEDEGIQPASGTWGTDNFWTRNGTSLRDWPGRPSNAFFTGTDGEAGEYLITVNSTQEVGNIVFESNGYKLSGDTIKLEPDATITGTAGKSLSIESVVHGDGGISLLKTGGGSKTEVEFLNANNSFTGPLVLGPDTRLNFTYFTDGGSNSSLGKSGSEAANLILDGGNLRFVGTSNQSSNRLFNITENGAFIYSSSEQDVGISFTNPDNIAFTGSGDRELELGGNPVVVNVLASVLQDPSTGKTSLRKTGNAIWALTGNNTFTGGTIISVGELRIGNATNTGTLIGDIENNSILSFNRANDYNFSGEISGTGMVKQLGTATLELSGNHTYTGNTLVENGTLLLTGSLANTQVNVKAQATLTGNGTLGGVLNLDNDAILSPGQDNAATLQVGELNLSESSILNFDLGNTSDLVIVDGDLSLNGVINVNPGPGFKAGTYTLINYSGNLVDNTLEIGNLPEDFTGEIVIDENKVVFSLQKTIKITGNFTAKDKIYDGSKTAEILEENLSLELVDPDHEVNLQVVLEFMQSDVGNNIPVLIAASSTLTGADAHKYILSLDGAPSTQANISPKTVEIIPNAGLSKIYGENDPVLSYTNSEWPDNTNINGNLTRDAGENAGTYDFTLDNLDAGPNYSLQIVDDPERFEIIKKVLEVTADDKNIIYGEDTPTFTLSYDGFVNGEDVGDLANTNFALSTDYSTGDDIGTYTITLAMGSATDNNYNFTPLNNGTLTVGKKAITITADDQSKIYGENHDLGSTAFTVTAGTLFQAADITAVTL
ncbi:MAG: hypothetical protein GX801_07135, partial [Fibrobacter sp.]|nr:hypothetical protein [Fibrobacter sp.]